MAIIIQKGDLAATSFSNNNTNNAGGISVRVDPASTVGAAIAAAIASLPSDKFLQGLQSYAAATNTLTLRMSDGSTVAVDLTALLADATATITAGKVAVYANDGTTLLGHWLAP